MTFTLFGRWQTRIFLISTVGVLVTVPFAAIASYSSLTFLLILFYLTLLGLIWDGLYNFLQQFKWDRDWPGIFQLFAGIWEALFLITLIKSIGLPLIPKTLAIPIFVVHYTCVWLAIYLSSQILMKLLFPHWRFHGGRLF
ncbi:hypothetical protein JJD41_00295 [Oxynema sp. CENA135]|uniref:hypothetical protein n=1 Tax=Oxynema sp. CENA135 TaxID=984206 RepID=UPI00190CF9DC|nr:hypothetical protein [Oxynema sp. CENA135]MBK4728336.1 hypothetical protein [Oxynema sp. CENA135]